MKLFCILKVVVATSTTSTCQNSQKCTLKEGRISYLYLLYFNKQNLLKENQFGDQNDFKGNNQEKLL